MSITLERTVCKANLFLSFFGFIIIHKESHKNKLLKKTYSTKQVVNATLKRWNEKNYIVFLKSQTDRREKKIILSSQGQEYAASIIAPLEKMEEAAFNSLSVQEQQTMIQLTGHYYQALLSQMQLYFVQGEGEKATKEKL